MSVQNTIFCVVDEPYCLWEVNIKERNNEYLDSIDHEFFEYLGVVNFDQIQGDEKKRAAIAIRMAYFQGMETLFLLIGALVQGYDCAYAWVAKCMTGDLRQIVEKISEGTNTIKGKVKIDHYTWESIARVVFAYAYSEPEKVEETAKAYAKVWGILAHEYLNKTNAMEYNSIKHGIRAKSGGFGLAIGLEEEYGQPAPKENMKSLGHSEFGSSFFALERVGESKGSKNRSVKSRRHSVNWSPDSLVMQLQLISMSIGNVVSILKILNGATAGTVKFYRPVDIDDFERPWKQPVGVRSCSLDFDVDERIARNVTKDELLDVLNKHES
jgi:hypothetical protein